MNTGFINQRIEIFSNNNSSDGYGGSIPGLSADPYWSTNAEVKQLSSSRTLEANQDELMPVFVFRIRYRDDKNIIDDMIVKWRGSDFVIQGYKPDVVYKEYVEFRAKPFRIGDLVQGSQSTTVKYGWFDTEQDPNTVIFQSSKVFPSGQNTLSIDFSAQAQNKYIGFSQPITELTYTKWVNNSTFNYGEIPDSVFKSGVVIGDEIIFLTRAPFIFEDGNYNINFGI